MRIGTRCRVSENLRESDCYVVGGDGRTLRVLATRPFNRKRLSTRSRKPPDDTTEPAMPCLVTSEAVDNAIRVVLAKKGFSCSGLRVNGQTGVDILATKGEEVWHIESVGYKTSPPARSIDFYQVFFRAISRLRDGATRLAIALPKDFGRGLHQRASQYGVAWDRIAAAFPELEIWLVECEPPGIRRTTWGSWR